MTDLLTKEERETVERIRKNHAGRLRHIRTTGCAVNVSHNDRRDLLAIIDNLSKRGVKKYSQRELHRAFQKQIEHCDWIAKDGRLGKQYDEWLKCACFLGALEEK